MHTTMLEIVKRLTFIPPWNMVMAVVVRINALVIGSPSILYSIMGEKNQRLLYTVL